MKWEIIYNNIRLNDYCNIIDVSKTILPNRKNNSKNIASMNGSYYTGFEYGERIISVKIYIPSKDNIDYNNKIKELSSILNVDKPKKMIINDDLDKYVYAVINGDTELSKKAMVGSVTLEFICHDPIIYSDKWVTFTPNERGIATLQNNSTYKTYPNIGVSFRKKACFLQVTNKFGETVLVGRPKEAGSLTSSESDIILHDNCESSTTFTPLSESLLPHDYGKNGTFGVGFNGNGIVCNNYGSGDKWHGTGFRRNLGADVDEFELEVDFVMSCQGKNYEISNSEPLPPEAPPNESGTSHGVYKVVNCGGLWINREPNTNNPIYAMSPGTLIYPEEIQGNWAKHTHKTNQGQTYTGWSYMKYLQKVSDSKSTFQTRTDEEEFAESQLGNIKMIGFDRNGTPLFEAWLYDSSFYFESLTPNVYIGGKRILHEEANGTRLPDYQPSGAIGRWNDFDGKFVIRREKNEAGNYLWTTAINKYKDGQIIESLGTQNYLCDSKFPTGKLNYIGFFIGAFKDSPPMSIMAICDIKVKKLNFKTDEEILGNITLFNPNDDLQINFSDGSVLLNGLDIKEKLDIGSNFFYSPPGESQLIIRSDDDTLISSVSIQERYI